MKTLKIINKFLVGLIVIAVFFLTVGIAYSYFAADVEGVETNTTITAEAGYMNIVYNGGATINAVGIGPSTAPFATKTFTVSGTSTLASGELTYKLTLIIDQNTFTENAISYTLNSTNTGANGDIASPITERKSIIGTETKNLGSGKFLGIITNKVHNYELKLYFYDAGTDQTIDMEKTFKAHVSIKNSNYVGYNDAKDVNKPVLFTGMTPVKWNGTAFVNTTADDPTWYNYNNKEWANAKTLDGSYWVWIPRYAYKIASGYNSSTTGTIDVKFLKGTSNETKDGTKIESTGYTAGVKDTSNNYFLHPAFEFNDDELGFWVAKYEPTAAEGVVSDASECNAADNVTTKTVKIIPNAISWRCINIATAHTVSQEMKNKTAIYGWLETEVDSHLMKNTEWGAVTYLSKSKYGANTLEVWNNAYSGYRTGCSGSEVDAAYESTCVTYNTTNGQKASTTHNITGVYDMSGGSYERIMSNYNNLSGSSGFNTSAVTNLNSKYISKYKTRTENMLNGFGMDYDLNVYGDAIYETSNGAARHNGSTWQGTTSGSWYGDSSYLSHASSPWYSRGGHSGYSSIAGLFFYFCSSGGTSPEDTFRPVLFEIK